MANNLSADARAAELSVVLHPDLTAAEKISHRSDGLLGVFGAGTDGENEVAEGKLGAGLKDLRILFHNGLHYLQQIGCHPISLELIRGKMFKMNRASACWPKCS
jgi:hypothetical protein